MKTGGGGGGGMSMRCGRRGGGGGSSKFDIKSRKTQSLHLAIVCVCDYASVVKLCV